MKTTTSGLFHLISATLFFVSACSQESKNNYPEGLPEKWLLLSKIGNDQVIEEGSWGFDQVQLTNENGKLTSISVTNEGGADQYEILEVQVAEGGTYFTFVFDQSYNPYDIENIIFYWSDQNRGTGVWKTFPDRPQLMYVAEASKDNFSVIAYEEDEQGEEIVRGSKLTQKLVYLGAEFSNGSIYVRFKNPKNETLEFDSNDFGDNTLIFYDSQADADGLPIVTNNEVAVNKQYEITYHYEERENNNSGEVEQVPIFDSILTGESSSIEILKYFEELPLTAFNHTTEGLSASDRANLINDKGCDSWGLAQDQAKQLTIYSKNGDSNVRMAAYPLANGDLLAVATTNEQAMFLTFWRKEVGKWSEVTNESILPPISDEDFFDVATGKSAPKSYTLNEKREIVATPNIWMNPDYEELAIKYNVLLSWNGSSFSKTRIKMDS